jgi:hypothetical protein
MNDYEKQLWNRISRFQFDEPGIAFSFSDRLANENNWKKDFAARAIEEYRRFIYLCCVAEHQVTPSDEVDQVWHLHLTFTRSYWQELCGKVTGKELHHNPTKGGRDEEKKFAQCYARTLASYRAHFGEDAPKELWPDEHKRFQRAKHIRVDALRNWVIRKPTRRIRIAIVVIILSLGGMLNVQAYDNKDVIVGLIVMGVIGVIAAINWRNGGGGGNGGSCSSGCNTSGCGTSHSGCSSSGCGSGCGGGGCGGCGS